MSRNSVILNIMWQADKENSYHVGYFIQTDGFFYIRMKKELDIEEARKKGYKDFGGILPGNLIYSKELFNCIKDRLLPKEQENPGTALSINFGCLPTDSFYFSETSLKQDKIEKIFKTLKNLEQKQNEKKR